MALHGTICVNNETIGNWEARRVDRLDPATWRYQYDCAVEMKGGRKLDFKVYHVYEAGAMVLATKVLERATELIEDEG